MQESLGCYLSAVQEPEESILTLLELFNRIYLAHGQTHYLPPRVKLEPSLVTVAHN